MASAESLKSRGQTLRHAVLRYTRLGVGALACLKTVGVFAAWNRFAELTTHFEALAFVFAIVLAALCLALRSWKWAGVAAVVLALYGMAVLPWYLPPRQAASSSGQSNLRLLLANVLTSNDRFDDLVQIVRRENPDVVLLQETSDAWLAALAPLEDAYPHKMAVPRSDNFGIAILSRIPLEDSQANDLGNASLPGLRADIAVNGRTVTLLNYHTLPPVSPIGFMTRNQQLAALPAFTRRQKDLVIIAGDLNVTMWSPYYKRLVRNSGLASARKGFGILATWPTYYPLVRIPIDHYLVSPEVRVIDLRMGPKFGSDHRPLVADLFIPPRHDVENVDLARASPPRVLALGVAE